MKRNLILVLPILALVGCEAKVETSVTTSSSGSSSSDSVSSSSDSSIASDNSTVDASSFTAETASQEAYSSSNALDLTDADKVHAKAICAAHNGAYDGYVGPSEDRDGDIDYTITCKPNGETNP